MIDRLNSYAKTHFRYEETLMKNRGYPELESHKRFHTYFETQLQEFEKLAVAGSKVATKTVFKFLRDWFLDHILEEDHKYIPYVRTKKNGVWLYALFISYIPLFYSAADLFSDVAIREFPVLDIPV